MISISRTFVDNLDIRPEGAVTEERKPHRPVWPICRFLSLLSAAVLWERSFSDSRNKAVLFWGTGSPVQGAFSLPAVTPGRAVVGVMFAGLREDEELCAGSRGSVHLGSSPGFTAYPLYNLGQRLCFVILTVGVTVGLGINT